VPALLGDRLLQHRPACALPKRIFAPGERYGDVVEAFAAAAATMTVGPPSDPAAQLGPLSTRPQFERVKALAEDAVRRGARVAAGGHPGPGPGFFFEPTILADIADSTPVVAEEQFGPVLPILRYATVDEAVGRANDTTFGLCGSGVGRRRGPVRPRSLSGWSAARLSSTPMPTCCRPSRRRFQVERSWTRETGHAGLLAFTEPQVVHVKKAGS